MSFRRRNVQYTEGAAISPSNLRKESVEKYAEHVAEVFDFGAGDDPSDLVRVIGGRVHYQHLDDWLDEDGSIFVHADQDFDILLPTYTSPLRDRFTIAHELGHYFLHSDQGDLPIVAYRRGSTRIEWEANWFAASLLMPRAEFQEVCQGNGNLRRIAAHFSVSEDAARVRREALGV